MSDTCPKCDAPRAPEWHDFACYNDLHDHACDYAAGLLERAKRAEAALREHANQYAGHLDHAKNCPVCLLVAQGEPEASDE